MGIGETVSWRAPRHVLPKHPGSRQPIARSRTERDEKRRQGLSFSFKVPHPPRQLSLSTLKEAVKAMTVVRVRDGLGGDVGRHGNGMMTVCVLVNALS